MPGNAISGQDGDVVISGQALYELKKWSASFKSANQAYGSNATAGYKKRVAGIKDCSGSCDGVWDPGNPIYGTGGVAGQVREGMAPQVYLYIDAAQYWNVPCMVDDFKIDVDLDNGDIVGWAFNFSGNGQWTFDTVVEESSASSSSSSTSSNSSSSSST
jgi:hypothetical protein